MKSNYWLCKIKKFSTSENVHDFIYGLVIYSLLYPFGELNALVVTLIVACLRIYKNHKRYGEYYFCEFVATVSGALFLMTWYNSIDYLKTLL